MYFQFVGGKQNEGGQEQQEEESGGEVKAAKDDAEGVALKFFGLYFDAFFY